MRQRPSNRRISLRAQLLAVFVVATALVGSLVALSASNSFQSARRSATTQVGAETSSQAQQLRDSLDAVFPYLTSIVAQPAIRSSDPRSCGAALHGLGALSVDAHVMIVEQSGRVVCSDGSLGAMTTLGTPAWLTGAFATGSGLGGPIHDPTVDRIDVAYAMAFDSSNGKRVALVGLISPATAVPLAAHNGVDPFVVDIPTGTVFATPAPKASTIGSAIDQTVLTRLVAGRETLTLRGPDGISRITSATGVPGTSWALMAGLPSDTALASARRDLQRNLGVGGLIVALLLGLGFLLHRRIARPLQRLRTAMDHVAADSVETRAPETGPAEFADLARSFNEMLDARASSEARFRSLVRYDSDFVTVVDADGVITYANPRAAAMFGLDAGSDADSEADSEAGAPVAFLSLVDTEDRNYVHRMMQDWQQSASAVDSRAEFRLVTRGGDVRYVEANVQNLVDDPAVGGLVVTCGDITERKAAEDRLTYAALHDSLTGLPNRPLVMDRLNHVLQRGRRDHTLSAVLFLDLDSFKLINDTAGHGTGDELLIQVADRLTAVCRPGDTLGRFGGDEFVIVCDGLLGPDDATAIAARVIDTREQPYIVNGQEVYIGGSIGIALARPEDDASALLRDADVAMYRAKASGRGSICVFDDNMRVATHTRLDIESALLHAADRGELSVHYQPIVTLDQARPVTLEALLRWTTADGTRIPPDKFIPIAEDTGLILSIGAWVLDESCRQYAEWRRDGALPAGLRLAVNVSARQLTQPNFASLVAAVLDRHDMPADRLVIEITESAIMRDSISSIGVLSEIRGLGVRISIDDFGTGYSSLGYLQRLPIDELKIDRAFVLPLSTGPNAASIVESIVSLGHALGLTVIAEGVETGVQMRKLRQIGCDLAQGYLFSPPVPADGVATWLNETHQFGGASAARV